MIPEIGRAIISPLSRQRLLDFARHHLEHRPAFPFQLDPTKVNLREVLEVKATPLGRSSVQIEALVKLSVFGRSTSVSPNPNTGERALARNHGMRGFDFEILPKATGMARRDGLWTIAPTAATKRRWQEHTAGPEGGGGDHAPSARA
jgi:hypothetical protein